MSKVVQLQELHEKNGHITEFAGFTLPLWFKGIVPESLAVRNAAGIFDVSHMGRVVFRGNDSQKLLDNITTNDVASLNDGQGQYSLLCNPQGGIKDDIVVFRLQDQGYLMVYNAGNREKDYDWIVMNSRGLDVELEDVSNKVAMFAIQGPKARLLVQSLSESDLLTLPRFGCKWTELAGLRALVSRTGYTGEDGFEVMVWNSTIENPTSAIALWSKLLETGKAEGLEPCGLGARDLLRLEAGRCLYGNEIDENTNPFEAKLSFVVKLQKDFIGKSKLQEAKEKGTSRVRVGLVTQKRVIPRHGFPIMLQNKQIGEVTSGSLSPIINTGIAMGYVEKGSSHEGVEINIQIRDRLEKAKLVKPPFYNTTRYGYSRKV